MKGARSQKSLWWIDDRGRLHIQPHPGQARAWRSERRFVFVLAGTQGGKTSFGPWWLFREIYGWDNCRGHGPGDYLAVTATFDLFKLKMLPALQEVFCHLMGVGRYWGGDKVIELKDPERGEFWAARSTDPMWGRIILRSAVAPGGLEAATAKAAWLDEVGQDDFTLESWEAVLRRLSLHQGRVLGTTTLYNVGWLKTEVYDAWVDGDPDFEVIQFPSVMNPAFPKREFERAARTLPDWRFSMFYLGRYARPAGLIYGAFSDEMLVDPFPIPPDWKRVVGIDFGGANTALVWLAEDPDTGIWYAYRESLSGGKSTLEHVAEAKENASGCQDITFVGGSASETQARMDWRAAGLAVEEPTVTDVEAGIDRVTVLIKSGRFRVFRTCRGLRDELGSYRRRLDETGEPTDQIVDKRKYHRLDALRYAATWILPPAPQDPGVWPSKLFVSGRRKAHEPDRFPQKYFQSRGRLRPGKSRRNPPPLSSRPAHEGRRAGEIQRGALGHLAGAQTDALRDPAPHPGLQPRRRPGRVERPAPGKPRP